MATFNCRVCGILLNNKNETLLIKRSPDYLPDSQEHIGWEFCGGGIEHDETPEHAIIREYKEETGLTVKTGQILNARTGQREDGRLLNLLFLCRYVSGNVTLTREHGDYKWVPLNKLKEIDLGKFGNLDRDCFLKSI